MKPNYTSLSPKEWDLRAQKLEPFWRSCDLCPRHCKVDRLADERGDCGAGALVSLVSYGPHHGEENCLSGWRGSGTLFFGHCNLHCIFCQNADISQNHSAARSFETAPERVASAMLALQARGCHNINWVSPTPHLYGILQACKLAAEKGLSLPIVYNTHSYDRVEVLRVLDGVVDIYLPDLKYADSAITSHLGAPPDYPARARAAIAEMYRQVGGLQLDGNGLAVRGVLVRLLVLPHDLGGTLQSLVWIRTSLGPDVGVNIMGQYHPAYRAFAEPRLCRRVRPEEYAPIVEKAFELGFHYIDFDNSLCDPS